jgi:putative ABC transport system substrate-binding protein
MGLTRAIAALLALLTASHALAENVLILYPQVREPYTKIYQDTLEGIKQTYKGTRTTLVIVPGQTLEPGVIARTAPNLYVALGNDAARELGAIAPEVPVITTANKDISFKVRHQLAYYPDPDTLLAQLQRFQPGVRSLFVVAETDTNPYQLRVRETLARAGLELKVCVAGSLAESAVCYRQLLDAATPQDAIWLLHGGKLLEPALLANILSIAWQRQLTVFSSNPDHVRRGALFSLYPDNRSAGRQLGDMITACLAPGNCKHSETSYLRAMGVALNERTSRHLGLTISPAARQSADLIL